MLESFLVLFRETLEAALVVGIVLGYLARTGQTRYRLTVWVAVATGAAASVLIAWLFQRLAGGFEGRAEQIFEGLVMLAGAALLTTLIVWMAGKRDAAVKLEHGVERHLAPGGSHGAGLFVLLCAAGRVAHGLHELVKAGWLPALVDPVWDLNPLLPEQGLLGSLLRGLFGYNGNPSLLELLGYAAYAAVAASLWRTLAGQS